MAELSDADVPEALAGVRFLQQVRPLLAWLHEDATQRDRTGNRQIFVEHVCGRILLTLFNPSLKSLRDWQGASKLARVPARSWVAAKRRWDRFQRRCGCLIRSCWWRSSRSCWVDCPDRLDLTTARRPLCAPIATTPLNWRSGRSYRGQLTLVPRPVDSNLQLSTSNQPVRLLTNIVFEQRGLDAPETSN